MLHPSRAANSTIAVFIWDEGGTCGGSAVLFGTARFVGGEFYVEREEPPRRMPIPESAWDNLRVNSDKNEAATFGLADYTVMLKLGPIPEGESMEGYEQIDIPILNDQSSQPLITPTTESEQGVPPDA